MPDPLSLFPYEFPVGPRLLDTEAFPPCFGGFPFPFPLLSLLLDSLALVPYGFNFGYLLVTEANLSCLGRFSLFLLFCFPLPDPLLLASCACLFGCSLLFIVTRPTRLGSLWGSI